jgi:ABC-type glycerol-3-phosphate transport system permease component
MERNYRPLIRRGVFTLLLALLTVLFALPLYWLGASSFMSSAEITGIHRPLFPRSFKLDNYSYVFVFLKFQRTFFNSVFTSALTTVMILATSSMAGYAFAKKRFPFSKALLGLLVGTMAIPPTVLLLPLFFVINRIGFYDNLWGLIFPFGVTVFGIYFMRQYISDIPDALSESARMDGASEAAVFLKIMLPLLSPAMVSLAIIEFVNNWNSFTMPLVLLKTPEKYTLPLMLGFLSQKSVEIDWGHVMAANVLSILPVFIIYVVLQRFLVKGIMQGSIKG